MSEGWATLEELETHWSIDDVADANEVLDAVRAAERVANQPKPTGPGRGI